MRYKKSRAFDKKNQHFLGSSVFRERSRTPNIQHQQQQALADKFLRAIEEEREKEEEEEYRQQLRNLWNRYQTEEGNMEKELFDNDFESDYPLNNDIDRKRNRQVNPPKCLKNVIISISFSSIIHHYLHRVQERLK